LRLLQRKDDVMLDVQLPDEPALGAMLAYLLHFGAFPL